MMIAPLADRIAALPEVAGAKPLPCNGETPSATRRRHGCEGDSACTMLAAKAGWRALDCSSCPLFEQPVTRSNELAHLAWQRNVTWPDLQDAPTRAHTAPVKAALTRLYPSQPRKRSPRINPYRQEEVMGQSRYEKLPKRAQAILAGAIHQAKTWSKTAAEKLHGELEAVGADAGTPWGVYSYVYKQRRRLKDEGTKNVTSAALVSISPTDGSGPATLTAEELAQQAPQREARRDFLSSGRRAAASPAQAAIEVLPDGRILTSDPELAVRLSRLLSAAGAAA